MSEQETSGTGEETDDEGIDEEEIENGERADEEVDTATVDESEAEEGAANAEAIDEADDEETAEEAADAEAEKTAVADELTTRVSESDPKETAREIAALRDRTEQLEGDLAESETEREALESKLTRKQADFQNFKKRQEKRREQVEQRATEDLVERLLDVRDNLVRALEQGEDVDIRDGVGTTRRQFDRILETENVESIDPEPGAEVDPQRHEVLMRVESDREAGTVDEVHRTGYEMGGKVLRPAQVTVADE